MDPRKPSSFSSIPISRLSQSHPSLSPVSPFHSPLSLSQPSDPPLTSIIGLNVDRLRPRAKTIDLESPEPEIHPSKYTEARIRAGKEYATRRLNSKTRKPSPTLEKLLCIYLLACKQALEHVKEGEPPMEVISEVRQYELEMSERNWYSAAGKSTASQKLEEDVLELRRLQYCARYGDYAAIMAHGRRKQTKEQQTDSRESISVRCSYSELAGKLHKEAEYFDKNGSKSAPEQASTSQAVYAACMAVGIDFHQTRLAIYAYGERCDVLQNDILRLVERNWGQAAKTLFWDIEDLSNVMSPGMEAQEEAIRAILLELRDEWFDIEPPQFSEPSTWFPNYKVRREVKASRNPETRKQARVAHEEGVARGAARRVAKLEEDIPVDQLGTKLPPDILPGPGPMPPPKQPKRKTNQELTGGDRKKAWNTIITQQVGAKAFFRTSLQKQREVYRVVSSYDKESYQHPPPHSTSEE
ncbi:hypothetical protein MMC17_002751 [Xylographa soralifera]|nr:hypothetical protein [Xylographa soralifera]